MIRQTLCSICGMRHAPGNCAAFEHLGDGYVALRNEFDGLKVLALAKEIRRKTRRRKR